MNGAGQKLCVEDRERVRNNPRLGLVPDTWLAKEEGVSKFTIARARRRKGIPPFKPSRVEPPISDISVFLNNWRR